MSSNGQLRPGPLPPEYHEHAANLARWFPEVLLTLGAPGLEETCAPPTVHVATGAGGRAIEVVLELRAPPTAEGVPVPPAPALVAPIVEHRDGMTAALAGLEALAADYEALAARTARQATRRPPYNVAGDIFGRLDAAADDLLALSLRLGSASSMNSIGRGGGAVLNEVPSHTPSSMPLSNGAAVGDVSDERLSPQNRQAWTACQRHASCPADFSPSAVPTPVTPGSGSRGGHQGRQGFSARQAGRSRAKYNTVPAKAAAWRSERDDSMKISINKVSQLMEEPASPKFDKMTKVWGSCSTKPIDESTNRNDHRSAASIKERIDKRLNQLFGGQKVLKHLSAPSLTQ